MCCEVKRVSGRGSLDGAYILSESTNEPHPACEDNCIYWKVEDFGHDFCFKEVEAEDGANIQCDAASPTDILSTLSTASLEILLNTTAVEDASTGSTLPDSFAFTTRAVSPQVSSYDTSTVEVRPATSETTNLPATPMNM